MKKSSLAAAVLLFALGLGAGNLVTSHETSKIAVVDIQTLVSKSSQVQALKKEQAAKMQELGKWLETVSADINKQSTEEGKQKLIKKYNAEYAKKQEVIKKNYKEKLTSVDKIITDAIANEAKTQGYDVVLSSSAVIYGGNNITDAVSKAIK